MKSWEKIKGIWKGYWSTMTPVLFLMSLSLLTFVFIVLYPVVQHGLDFLNFCDNYIGYSIFTLIFVVSMYTISYTVVYWMDDE